MGVEAETEHPMSVFKNGNYYHYEFVLDGRRIRGSTGQTNKQLAIQEERRQRERREKTYQQIVEEEVRTHQRKTVQQAADEFFADYKLKHRSPTYAKYALDHVNRVTRRPSDCGSHAQDREEVSVRPARRECRREDDQR